MFIAEPPDGNIPKPELEPYRFVALEGVDGSGKTTVMNLINEIMLEHCEIAIRDSGISPAIFHGELRKEFFKDGNSPGFSIAAAATLLHMVDRKVVRPRTRVYPVFMDRWYWSFYAYQSTVTANSEEDLVLAKLFYQKLRKELTKPDMTFYCECPSEVIAERMAGRSDKNYLDTESQKRNLILLTSYEELISSETDQRVVRLNTNVPLEELKKQLTDELVLCGLITPY